MIAAESVLIVAHVKVNNEEVMKSKTSFIYKKILCSWSDFVYKWKKIKLQDVRRIFHYYQEPYQLAVTE